MPTLTDWLNALFSDREITVFSSASLAAEVLAKQQARLKSFSPGKPALNMKKPFEVSAFDPSLSVTLKPIELLHAIGRITTPPIANLVDISSTWALIRYLWAFEPHRHSQAVSPLRLSSEARGIDFHQKALLSDEVGVGLAFYLMVNYFNATNPIDASLAVKDSLNNLNLNGRIIPDYIFFDETTGAKFVVECKGTQTSRATSINQLERGTEQVLA